MKHLKGYLHESIFDIDDETITNKNSYRTNIFIDDYNKSKYDKMHIDTENVKHLIDLIYDDYSHSNVDFDIEDVCWEMIAVVITDAPKCSCWYVQAYKKHGEHWKTNSRSNIQIGFIYFNKNIDKLCFDTDNVSVCKPFQTWIKKEISKLNSISNNDEKLKELCN